MELNLCFRKLILDFARLILDFIFLKQRFGKSSFWKGIYRAKVSAIFIAAFTPSIAEEVIPPAYPAPSPQG